MTKKVEEWEYRVKGLDPHNPEHRLIASGGEARVVLENQRRQTEAFIRQISQGELVFVKIPVTPVMHSYGNGHNSQRQESGMMTPETAIALGFAAVGVVKLVALPGCQEVLEPQVTQTTIVYETEATAIATSEYNPPTAVPTTESSEALRGELGQWEKEALVKLGISTSGKDIAAEDLGIAELSALNLAVALWGYDGEGNLSIEGGFGYGNGNNVFSPERAEVVRISKVEGYDSGVFNKDSILIRIIGEEQPGDDFKPGTIFMWNGSPEINYSANQEEMLRKGTMVLQPEGYLQLRPIHKIDDFGNFVFDTAGNPVYEVTLVDATEPNGGSVIKYLDHSGNWNEPLGVSDITEGVATVTPYRIIPTGYFESESTDFWNGEELVYPPDRGDAWEVEVVYGELYLVDENGIQQRKLVESGSGNSWEVVEQVVVEEVIEVTVEAEIQEVVPPFNLVENVDGFAEIAEIVNERGSVETWVDPETGITISMGIMNPYNPDDPTYEDWILLEQSLPNWVNTLDQEMNPLTHPGMTVRQVLTEYFRNIALGCKKGDRFQAVLLRAGSISNPDNVPPEGVQRVDLPWDQVIDGLKINYMVGRGVNTGLFSNYNGPVFGSNYYYSEEDNTLYMYTNMVVFAAGNNDINPVEVIFGNYEIPWLGTPANLFSYIGDPNPASKFRAGIHSSPWRDPYEQAMFGEPVPNNLDPQQYLLSEEQQAIVKENSRKLFGFGYSAD